MYTVRTGPYAWARAELNGFEIVIVKGADEGGFLKTQPTIRIHLKGARGLSLKAVGPGSYPPNIHRVYGLTSASLWVARRPSR